MTANPFGMRRRVHLLIDPDKWTAEPLAKALGSAPKAIGTLIVGGTYIHSSRLDEIFAVCHESGIPTGALLGASSLSTGDLNRNPSFLLVPLLLGAKTTHFVTDHLLTATEAIRASRVKVSTYAYLMFEGTPTSAEFFTQHRSIPRDKPEIVRTLSTCASFIGLRGIYLDAGSNAVRCITSGELQAAIDGSSLPVLVGGGIQTASQCMEMFDAGACGVIVGTAAERCQALDWLSEVR